MVSDGLYFLNYMLYNAFLTIEIEIEIEMNLLGPLHIYAR